ncbi:FtsH protease activity modulator HflK [Rhodopirellula sp. P2]|uniref:FtsH protease activity modulator HflK n=1 Tax=Rhodopirellula sp. P2 TaxID=2127060 RepID=UPI0023679A1C|nr:FtsH protease activity modulator HflK [Rhodopirellula sp. P2]WDQ14590.1 FtsH protease activity modulator HflK [Rhodopirellula sp. P2]
MSFERGNRRDFDWQNIDWGRMEDFRPLLFWGVPAMLLALLAYTSVYTVQAESQGVVLRFGKYIKTVDPGLRYKLPFGVDQVSILPVKRQLKQEFGFGTEGASDTKQYSNEQAEERSMVTGDLNAATVEWIIQYRIRDPQFYLFEVRNPGDTLRAISESVMRTVVGDRTVDEVITVGRQEIEAEALVQLQDVVNKYQLGLSIDQVQLKNVNPPVTVQPSFNEVNQAQQEREKMINVANGEYNKVVPRASGEAEQKIQAAEGYALKRVNEAEGDVSRFNAVLTEYLKAPEVTKRRIYIETMRAVVPNLGKKIILDEEASQILPLLQMSTDTQRGQR